MNVHRLLVEGDHLGGLLERDPVREDDVGVGKLGWSFVGDDDDGGLHGLGLGLLGLGDPVLGGVEVGMGGGVGGGGLGFDFVLDVGLGGGLGLGYEGLLLGLLGGFAVLVFEDGVAVDGVGVYGHGVAVHGLGRDYVDGHLLHVGEELGLLVDWLLEDLVRELGQNLV